MTDPVTEALRQRVIREITVAPGWNLEDATVLVDELLAQTREQGRSEAESEYRDIHEREMRALEDRVRALDRTVVLAGRGYGSVHEPTRQAILDLLKP